MKNKIIDILLHFVAIVIIGSTFFHLIGKDNLYGLQMFSIAGFLFLLIIQNIKRINKMYLFILGIIFMIIGFIQIITHI